MTSPRGAHTKYAPLNELRMETHLGKLATSQMRILLGELIKTDLTSLMFEVVCTKF